MRTFLHFSLAVLLLGICEQVVEPASAQGSPGSSPLSPAGRGVTVAGIIECGQGYTSHELYDMRITLLDLVRGDEAWKRIREAGVSNKPAAEGQEYILARIRFEYFARGKPGQCVHELKPEQFTAVSAAGEEYPHASVAPPQPTIAGSLRSGDSREGWVVIEVPRGDSKPLMYYSADAGAGTLHGGGTWFKLY